MTDKLKKFLQSRLIKIMAVIMLLVGIVAFIWTGDFKKALLITAGSYFPAAILTFIISIIEDKVLSPRRYKKLIADLGDNALLELGFKQNEEYSFDGLVNGFNHFVLIMPQYPTGCHFLFETAFAPANVTEAKLEELAQYYEVENIQDHFYTVQLKLENRPKAPDGTEIRQIIQGMADTLKRMQLSPAE